MKRALYGLTTVMFMLMVNHGYTTNMPFENHIELSQYLLFYGSNDLSQNVLTIESYDSNHQLIDVNQYHAGSATHIEIIDHQLVVLGGSETLWIDLTNGYVSALDQSLNDVDMDASRNQIVYSQFESNDPLAYSICLMNQFPLGSDQKCTLVDGMVFDYMIHGQTIYVMKAASDGNALLVYDTDSLQLRDTFPIETRTPWYLIGISRDDYLIVADENLNWMDMNTMEMVDPTTVGLVKMTEPHYLAECMNDPTMPDNAIIDSYYQNGFTTTAFCGDTTCLSFWDMNRINEGPFMEIKDTSTTRYPWLKPWMIAGVWIGK